jgi:hypothetical protein
MHQLTNRAVAEELGCRPEWVSRVLLAKVPAPARFRSALAELLDVDEGQLFR